MHREGIMLNGCVSGACIVCHYICSQDIEYLYMYSSLKFELSLNFQKLKYPNVEDVALLYCTIYQIYITIEELCRDSPQLNLLLVVKPYIYICWTEKKGDCAFILEGYNDG